MKMYSMGLFLIFDNLLAINPKFIQIKLLMIEIMTSVSNHPLLQVTENDIISIRKMYNLDIKTIQENLDAIEEWWKKEDHLIESLQYFHMINAVNINPLKNADRDVLERIHILAKGSIERTKIMIDKILTARGLLPEFVIYDSYDEFENFLDNLLFTTLPKLNTKDNTRVMLLRFMNESFENFTFLHIMRIGFYIGEIRTRYDYIFDDRYILDFKYVKANMVKKFNPIMLKKAEIFCTETYGVRIKGIHVVNAPSYVDIFIGLLKQVLKEKIAKRIFVHSSYEDLYNQIPKEILPKEYGGDLPSCQTLIEQWKKFFKTEEAKEFIVGSRKLVSNESKRSCIKFNEEYLGMPGSFKRLNVD